MPHEASLSYSQTYLQAIQTVTQAMGKAGETLWEHPRLKATYLAYADLVCLNRFTHFAADMGGIQNNG